MLIEQNIEFELSGSGPTGRNCTSITNYFYAKIKIHTENLPSGLLFTAEVLQEAMYLTYPYLGQTTYKI